MLILYLFISKSDVCAQDVKSGPALYNQAVYYLKKKDYDRAFLYFSIACYNKYLPGCDMMGMAEYATDQNKGLEICKKWLNELANSDNDNDKKRLQVVLKYYISAFKELGNKKEAEYFQKQYDKIFLGIKIENINPKKDKK